MAKITLTDAPATYSPTILNANNVLIEAAIEDQISRSGATPNTMDANLDMNTNKVVNAGEPTALTDLTTKNYVDGAISAGIGIPEASIDHANILNVGSNSHAAIDTHLALTSVHYADATADGTDYVRNNNAWVAISGAAIPSQTGNGGKGLFTNGSSMSWQHGGGVLSYSTNTTLGITAADALVLCTNTITISLPASSSISTAWGVMIKNNGTGIVAVTPTTGANTVDGVAGGTWYIFPGETMTIRYGGSGDWHIVDRGERYCGVHAYLDADQTIGNASATALAMDQEDHDTLAFHDLVTNNSRITIPANAGIRKVQLFGQISWVANATGIRYSQFYKGGTAAYQGLGIEFDAPGNANVSYYQANSPVIGVADTNYFELMAYQTSGGNLDARGDATTGESWFAMKVVDREVV